MSSLLPQSSPSPDFDLQSSDSDNYLAFSLRTQPSSKRRRTSGRVRETDERKGPIERFKRCDRTPLRELFLSSLPGIILVTVVWLDHCHIFNSKLVLGSPETATDADYAAILGVIGHECKFCGREGTVLMVGYEPVEFTFGSGWKVESEELEEGNVSSLVDAILNFHDRIDSDDSNDYERKSVLLGIAYMLESSHNLKTLVITMPSSCCPERFWEKFPGLCNFDEEHYWTLKYRLQTKPTIWVGPFALALCSEPGACGLIALSLSQHPNRQQDLQLQTATPPVHRRTAHLLFFTEEYSVRTMNHEVGHPGQELIGSSSCEAEEEEEKENKDGDDKEEKVKEEGMLPPRKRPRNQCLDRISALHDSLILHILSFLPMEDVVRTGTLSKRWECLWTCASTLVFQRDEFDLNDIDRFATFVNRTLVLCTCSNIKKFVLQFRHHPDVECFPPDTNLWIRFAMQNNVEELYLHFGGYTESHRLPQHLFTNSTLRTLSASNCIVAPGGGISWRSLKSLTLEYAELGDGVLAKILLGCPVLEFLQIRMIFGARRMDINSASLNMLVVHYCVIGDDEFALEISAPNLQVLELGDIRPRRFWLVNVSSLVRAKLNFSGGEFRDDHENMHNQVLELLERLKHVKQLHLGDWCIQVLSVGELKGLPSPMSTCKVLTINSHIMKWDFPGILRMLRGSPGLEKLVVDLSSCRYKALFVFCNKFLDSRISDGEDPWTSHKSSFFQLLHLKTIEIVGFMELEEGFQLPLVQFLLQNAVVLEKMVIKIVKSGDNQCSTCSLSQEFFRLTQKLMGLPRASPHAVVLIP
ncbi:hypothetical protein RHMOL_Rhmol13G0225600 [Rhododendron molle]|uniref:Uncharacterized protein n=1 Tax=Rhododendron molle TaxID=49168 RepID=A0ACC0LA36_RHOML|nr:hypothetical protein RHMOL_Rhmol13G0225600 [Rhododendron molle]